MPIKRSTGISPGIVWAGPLPGGGYQGSTLELDSAVASQAAWLEQHLHHDIEIRFNSDRLSGGAFIAGEALSHTLGLSVRLRGDGTLSYAVYAPACCLQDPALATEHGGDRYRYACPRFDTPEEAQRWLAENTCKEG